MIAHLFGARMVERIHGLRVSWGRTVFAGAIPEMVEVEVGRTVLAVPCGVLELLLLLLVSVIRD